MAQLNEAERETLNAAMAIIFANTPQGSHWMIGAHDYGLPITSVVYFDSGASGERGQHEVTGETLADKVQNALDIEVYAVSQREFPKPARKDGAEPCGECRLSNGETCDICGAIQSEMA